MSPAAGSSGNPPDASDFEVLQQAAEWFAVLGAPAVSPAQRQAWQAWRDADARHQAAWQQVENICGAFSHLPTADKAGARRALDTASERQLTRRRAAKMLLLLCGTGTLGWTAVRHTPWATWNAEYKTATGERRQVMLADGGGIWLNSASAIDVDYSGSLRRIHLHAGEILIQTARDLHQPPRPFVVHTTHGRMRALGTRFSVLQQDAATQVTVFEGAVELQPKAASAPALIVHAGQQSRMSRHGASPPADADSARQAWSQGLLLAENIRLADFIAELAHHRPGYLGCAPEIGELRLVGAYELGDTDRVLAALEATLPVRVRRVLPWWVVVEARQEPAAR